MMLKDVLEVLDKADVPYKWTYDSFLQVDVGDSHLFFSHARRSDIENGKYTDKDLVLFEVSILRSDVFVTDIEVKRSSYNDIIFVDCYYDDRRVGCITVEL